MNDGGRFTAADFSLLEDMSRPAGGDADSPRRRHEVGHEGPARPDADQSTGADLLWNKAANQLDELGDGLFGRDGARVALWPDTDDDERPPFLWGRIKRAGNERFSTHLGVFLSPGYCNLAIDLEKDPLDAGESAERLEQFVGFCSSDLGALLGEHHRDDLRVWTDTRNVVAAERWATTDFDGFMAMNRDQGHPWPKVGYILDAGRVEALGDRWLDDYLARARPLVPIYDAMIAAFFS